MRQSKKAIQILQNGGVGVLPTDTLYGVVGSAFSKKAVSKIYKLKKRNPKKPPIILISSVSDLLLFKVKVDAKLKKMLTRLWPGKVSVILPCRLKKYTYLHRGTKTLAFRVPASIEVRKLLKKTGPLIAPSANPEGKKPAVSINQARKYFDDAADFYVGGGKRSLKPSTLIAIRNNKIQLIRKGEYRMPHLTFLSNKNTITS